MAYIIRYCIAHTLTIDLVFVPYMAHICVSCEKNILSIYICPYFNHIFSVWAIYGPYMYKLTILFFGPYICQYWPIIFPYMY